MVNMANRANVHMRLDRSNFSLDICVLAFPKVQARVVINVAHLIPNHGHAFPVMTPACGDGGEIAVRDAGRFTVCCL